MDQCSICLESLDGGVVALACNHRFHAACLAQMAGAVGTATTRRGSLTACPNCRRRGEGIRRLVRRCLASRKKSVDGVVAWDIRGTTCARAEKARAAYESEGATEEAEEG